MCLSRSPKVQPIPKPNNKRIKFTLPVSPRYLTVDEEGILNAIATLFPAAKSKERLFFSAWYPVLNKKTDVCLERRLAGSNFGRGHPNINFVKNQTQKQEMPGGIARGRLVEERKSWRKNHPYVWFCGEDGSVNLMSWQCFVPGKAGTEWEGGHYPVSFKFNEDYPSKPPMCKFPQGFLHPNVYPSGLVCLSILSENDVWKPAITVRQILVGIQDLLDKPNPASPANHELKLLFVKEPANYKIRVRLQAKQDLPVI